MSAREVVSVFTSLGARLEEWSSLHFIPVRLLFAGARLTDSPAATALAYRIGERLRRLAPRRLGDYSVIAFSKPEASSPG